MNATTIGIDIPKSVFQVHGVDAAGQATVIKKLRRAEVIRFFEAIPPCLVGMEACATGHYWAREIAALGHQVRLMPPSYVKAYVRRQKTDAADAEAICEAVTRPTLRFVPIKSAERQGVLVLHRSRELLVRQRTMLINAIRGHCADVRDHGAAGRASGQRAGRACQAGRATVPFNTAIIRGTPPMITGSDSELWKPISKPSIRDPAILRHRASGQVEEAGHEGRRRERDGEAVPPPAAQAGSAITKAAPTASSRTAPTGWSKVIPRHFLEMGLIAGSFLHV